MQSTSPQSISSPPLHLTVLFTSASMDVKYTYKYIISIHICVSHIIRHLISSTIDAHIISDHVTYSYIDRHIKDSRYHILYETLGKPVKSLRTTHVLTHKVVPKDKDKTAKDINNMSVVYRSPSFNLCGGGMMADPFFGFKRSACYYSILLLK